MNLVITYTTYLLFVKEWVLKLFNKKKIYLTQQTQLVADQLVDLIRVSYYNLFYSDNIYKSSAIKSFNFWSEYNILKHIFIYCW